MNDLTSLRDHLFSTLDALKDKDNPMDLDRAKTVVQVAQAITDTAKVEVEFLKATGRADASGFIPNQPKQIEPPKPGTPDSPRLVRGSAASGSK